jgi:pimeloyl-ACP methyl ester carboxylesterase
MRSEANQAVLDERPAVGYLPRYSVEGSGPLLVFISGLDGTGQLFFKQSPALARSYRVVTFRSRERGQFTYEDLADDVEAIIKDLGEERAAIVAESFGGGVALTFALRYPQMIERLVVINSFPRFRNRLQIGLGAWLASLLPFPALWPLRKAACILGLWADGVTKEDRRRFFYAIRTVGGEGYSRRLRLILDLDLEEQLSHIQARTLFIAGEKDRLIRSVREARLMAGRMPHAAVTTIKGAGHACLLGNRVRLAEIIDR